MNRKSLFGVVLVAMLALTGSVAGWAQSSPLSFVPASAQITVYLPAVESFETEAAPLLALPAVKEKMDINALLGELPGKLGVADATSLSAVFKAAGLDATKPLAVYLRKNETGAMEVSGALPVADEAVATEKMKNVFSEAPAEVAVGEAKGLFSATQKLGYFIQSGYVLMGSTEPLLNELSARLKEPATTKYAASNAPSELAVITSFSNLQAAGIIPTGPATLNMEPTYQYFKSFIDEVALGIGVQDGEAYVRLAMHDPAGAVAPPASQLQLNNLIAGSSPLTLNLRNTPGFMDKVRTLFAGNPAMAKNLTYVMLASSMLGDELAVSVDGVNNNIPGGIVAAKLMKPESVKGLLGLAGVKGDPKYVHNGGSVYALENVKEGLNVYIATAGALLLVSTNEDRLKKALDGLAADGTIAAKSELDPALLAKGANGFIVLDGAKIDPAQVPMLPAGVNLADKKVVATLGVNGEWRELRIAVPGGLKSFNDVTSLM